VTIVSLSEWMKWYRKIVEVMGYDVDKDMLATQVLANYLINNHAIYPERILRLMIGGRTVFIFGAGPTLKRGVKEIIKRGYHENSVLIAADGATTALVEEDVYPDVIVTDLDGDIHSIMESVKRGTIPVIHAHGDNINKLNAYVPRFLSLTKLLVGTTQVEPVLPVRNFGGFTDGDRAVFLAANFNARRIILIGMDFGDIVGKYSKTHFKTDVKASEDKAKKLKIAHELISWLACTKSIDIYTTSDVVPYGVKKVRFQDISRLIK